MTTKRKAPRASNEKIETFITTLSNGTEVRLQCTVRTPPAPELPIKIVDEDSLGEDPTKNAARLLNGFAATAAAAREAPKPTTEWEIEITQETVDLNVETGKTTRSKKATTLTLAHDEAAEFFSALATMYARDKDRRYAAPMSIGIGG